jgi:hypothetical protein
MQLQIIQAKPNPVGKDKTGSGVPKPEQLLGEWVDIKNIGTGPVKFSTIHLWHTQFDHQCQKIGQPVRYWSGLGEAVLRPGEILRVHAGRSEHQHLMSAGDRTGADYHRFTGEDRFVLNNRCGDAIYVVWRDGSGNSAQDLAAYDPKPREGAILVRFGNKLLETVRK